MVAHTAERGVDGATIWRARTPAELERIAAIVRPAVGFDERRGDRVEVASMAFVVPPAEDETGTAGLFGLGLERAELFRIGETALAIGLFLIFIYAFARPTVARLVALNPHEPPPALAAVAMSAPTSLPPLEEAMVSMARVDGQVRAASLRALAGLVDERPEEAVQTLRNWLATEPA
jgi:flagellar M-ring protein FliF